MILGPCGVGKTHLATGLAVMALARGHRIYFLTLHDLVTKSRAARERNRLDLFLQTLLRPDLLVLNEIGYLPLERPDATCLFELVNKRYQLEKSIILTSNKSFAARDEIFPTPRSRPPCWTASSTARRRSPSAARATACGTAARPACPAHPHTPEVRRPPRHVSTSGPLNLSTSPMLLTAIVLTAAAMRRRHRRELRSAG